VKDDLYRQPATHLVDFVFDERVAGVFPDMIRRSVPGYELVVPMTGLIAARHLAPGDRAYDLGCSLGATTVALLAALGDTPCEVHAVDQSDAMLTKARTQVTDPRVRFIEADVRDLDFAPSRVVLSNWLLQFIPPDERLDLLRRIRGALGNNGLLLLSEKIRYEDPGLEAFMSQTHHGFKAANGYTDTEIRQKRDAIENVMIVDTESVHRDRLHTAGFSEVTTWFRCLNWLSMIVRT
jgi:tRNA (cmo5U34)-methyltransferase